MITTTVPQDGIDHRCSACGNEKGQPLAAIVDLSWSRQRLFLCQECGRDLANAVGFMCIREGGWSKLEPKRKARK